MPRRPRLLIAGIPLHITQRGVNRCITFVDADDHLLYRELLTELAVAHELDVHAYVLMSNHIHLLVTPTSCELLARAMRLLNQRYVGAFNRRHHRTGTLWESRFRSCLVDTEGYLLTLYRYIELNPVRAAMVDAPQRYPWSSARANLGIAPDPCLTPHPVYLALGTDAASRARAYRDWIGDALASQGLETIRLHIRQERALGSPHFQAMVAGILNRPVTVRPRGRPRKHVEGCDGRDGTSGDSNR